MAEQDGSGRRERKKVDFFAPETSKAVEEVVIKKGKGQELGEIPNVDYHLSKVKGADEILEDLHTILFRRKGKASARKKNIKKFSGFVYPEGSEDAEKAKDLQRISNLKIEKIHQLMDVLDVPRGKGDKESKVNILWEYLEEPKVLSHVDKAKKAAKKKGKRTKKVALKDGKASKKRKKEDAAEDTDGDDDDEVEVPAKKTGPKKAVAKAVKRKAKGKEGTPRKKAKGSRVDGVDDDELDAPLGVVAKLPEDDILEKDTLDVLATVNVEEFSLRGLLAQLEEKYGIAEGSISKHKQKKDVVKRTAITYCASKGPSKDAATEEHEGDDEAPAGDDEGAPATEEKVSEEEQVATDKDEAGQEDEEEEEEEEDKDAPEAAE